MRSAGKANSMPWCLRTKSTSSSLRKLGSLSNSCNTMTRCSFVDSWATWQFIGPKMKSWNCLQTTSEVAMLKAMHQPACFGMLWPSSLLCGSVRLNSRLCKRFKALTLKIPWRNLSWWTIRLGGRHLWWLRRNVIVLRWSPWMDMRRSQQNVRENLLLRVAALAKTAKSGTSTTDGLSPLTLGWSCWLWRCGTQRTMPSPCSAWRRSWSSTRPSMQWSMIGPARACLQGKRCQVLGSWSVPCKGHVANCPCHPTDIPRLDESHQHIHCRTVICLVSWLYSHIQFYGASSARVLCSGIWAQAQPNGEMQRLAALESVLYGEEASQGHSVSKSHEKAAFLSCHETPGIVIYFYAICAQTSCCEILNDIWIVWWQILWGRIAISEWFVILVTF